MTELLDAIKKTKEEFESIKRPKLQIETPIEKSETPSNQIHSSTAPSPSSITMLPNKNKQDRKKNSPSITMKTISIEELDKLSEDDSAEEISEWEFDAYDKDQYTMS